MTNCKSNGTDSMPRLWGPSIVRVVICAVLLGSLSLAPMAQAARSWVWTVTFAESQLETDYQTVDPWALRDAREELASDLRAGYPESSARIRHDRQDVRVAKRAGYVSRALCKGAGTSDGGYFGRFWCRVRIRSDLSGYQATRKLTVYVRGRESFATRPGWR